MNWPALIQLIRLPNQTGTLLLMLPSLWSLVLASKGSPAPYLVGVFMAGSFFMRSAGVTLNDLADQSFDRDVARTKSRPLASGAMSRTAALGIAAVLLLCSASLLLFLNDLTRWLSPVAVFLAALYPFSKRVIHLPQAMLGVAFGWGAVMAWSAVKGALEGPAWLLFAATVFWAVTYDTIYALQDREDDLRIGVKSSAILFGSWTWLAVALSSLGMLGTLAWCGWMVGIGPVYFGLLLLAAGFLGRQAWLLRKPVTPSEAFALFHQHVYVGIVILAGCLAGFL